MEITEPDTLEKSHRRMSLRKQSSLAVIASLALFVLVLVIALFPLFTTHGTTYAIKAGNRPVSTINGLSRISVVGSTAFIVDAHGRTMAVDSNPYGVTIVPTSIPASNAVGTLKAGDIVVTNIGANDTGTTLVRFPKKMGPGLLFNNVANPGTKGPNAEAFNTLSGQYMGCERLWQTLSRSSNRRGASWRPSPTLSFTTPGDLPLTMRCLTRKMDLSRPFSRRMSPMPPLTASRLFLVRALPPSASPKLGNLLAPARRQRSR